MVFKNIVFGIIVILVPQPQEALHAGSSVGILAFFISPPFYSQFITTENSATIFAGDAAVRFCFCNILYSKKNDRGGLGSHIQDLSLEFAKRGHEVTILTSGENKEYFEGPVKVVQLAKVARYSGAFQLLDPLYWIATSTLDYYQEILGSRTTRFHAVAEKSGA